MTALLTRATCDRAGVTRAELDDALHCCLARIRSGVYLVRPECTSKDHAALHAIADSTTLPDAEHINREGLRGHVARLSILVDSYRETLPTGSAFSHLSAALLWGLPVTRHVQDRAEVIRPERSVAYRQMLVRKRPLPTTDVAVLDGTRVTTVARTLSDVAHDYPLDISVPMIDAALRNRLITGDLTSPFPPSHSGRRGARRARLALSIADPSHESPAESICAVRLHEHGIDGFVTQVVFGNPDEPYRARVDFLHRAAKLILEVNGEIKYVDGEAGSRRARQERQRDYRLRNMGYRVYQLTWADLFSPDTFREIRRLVHAAPPLPG